MEDTVAGAMTSLTDIILKTENLIIVASVWALLDGVKKVVAKKMRHLKRMYETSWFARLEPVLPLALCQAAVWIPGIQPDLGVGDRIFLGLILGKAVGQAHKIFGQSFLGKDERIQNGKRKPDLELPE